MRVLCQTGKSASDRRTFLKKGMVAGAATVGASLLTSPPSAFAEQEEKGGHLNRGDAALLRFAAAAEILETDFWVQYNELGGVPNTREVPGGSGNSAYTAAIAMLDSDMAQYIHDNTDDEFTHQNFLNAYLESKGASPMNLEPFRTLPGSSATGSSGKLRLTNLMQLNAGYQLVDSLSQRESQSRPRSEFRVSASHSGPESKGSTRPFHAPTQTPAIPIFLQAIANTAGFHFPTIEQGGQQSLPVDGPARHASEVLRILISIGPTETMHFQTWSDKAGNAPPLTATDP